MTEIELKAHVKDRNALVATLNTIATYAGSVTRDDTYYKKDGISIRIRRETRSVRSEKSKTGTPSVTYLLTYKRKELRTSGEGTTIEVNDERECEISDPQPISSFLTDTGYTISLLKHKEVMDWTTPLPDSELEATLELCAVPPLGDFLEIEILSPQNDRETVERHHRTLESLLDRTGIPRTDIERRYYSELLKEAGANIQ